MKKMRVRHALVLIPAMLLAACGGGGGGGDGGSGSGSSGAASATAVTITSSNAPAIAAEAMQVSGSYEDATAASAFVTGVQVNAGGNGSPVLLGTALRKLLPLVPHTGAQATGVTNAQTVACTNGGSVAISATTASTDGTLNAGDSFQVTANGCTEGTGADAVVMNGSVAFTFASGRFDPASTSYPKAYAMRITSTEFSVSYGGETMVSNGDITLSVTEKSATEGTMALSSASSSFTIGSHRVAVKNYEVNVADTGTSTTVTVSMTVETDNSRVASSLVSYQITTLTPVTVDAAGNVTGGSIKVTGANSALVLTVSGTDTFTLQVDANGDGTYESTSTVTRSTLNALL